MAVPTQRVAGDALTLVIVGTALTVTDVVYTVVGLQPGPPVLTVRLYVPVAVGEAVGFCNAEVKPPGPVQDHAVAPVEFALKVTVAPTHIGPLFVGAAVGIACTVTTNVAVQPVYNV